MWYRNTFRAEILQYLEAILFDIEYTSNRDNVFNYANNLFVLSFDCMKMPNMSTRLVSLLFEFSADHIIT